MIIILFKIAKFARFASALSNLPPNQQRLSAPSLTSRHHALMTCNKFAYTNHELNINLFQNEQEVTVKRMSLWHVALLIDNQRTTTYQHDVSPKKLVRLCHK